MNQQVSKPTFVGIGAQKCASTWLYQVLKQHPEVCVSDDKELDFFSFNFDRGYQWYKRHFDCDQATRACGEISPSYFCEQDVAERVHAYDPSLKIIVSFRDPVERALSNHRHEVREGHFCSSDNSFEAGLANNPMYVNQGRYATHLKRWLEYFDENQIFTVLMEELRSDPEQVARRLYAFLDVDTSYAPEGLDNRYNESYANRSQSLRKIKDMAYSITSQPGLRWTWSVGRALGLRSAYRKVNHMDSSDVIPEPDEHCIEMLRSEFQPEVRELSRLINRPLDSWL